VRFLAWLLLLHSVTLLWNQSTDPNTAFNSIYCGQQSGGPYKLIYKSKKPITQATKLNVPAGTYFCVVTATDHQGLESKYSNEAQFTVPN
jgi:hypothetical protein